MITNLQKMMRDNMVRDLQRCHVLSAQLPYPQHNAGHNHSILLYQWGVSGIARIREVIWKDV